MYINKKIFMVYKIIDSIGLWIFGYLCIMIVLASVLSIIDGELSVFLNSAIIIPCLLFLILFVVLSIFNNILERAKVYDSFFEEAPDGIMQAHVLAKATGIKEERIVKELKFLIKLHLFRLDIEANGISSAITLYQPGAGAEKESIYQTICCPNCGAVNRVRKGFINTCAYCLGSLDQGVEYHVSK